MDSATRRGALLIAIAERQGAGDPASHTRSRCPSYAGEPSSGSSARETSEQDRGAGAWSACDLRHASREVPPSELGCNTSIFGFRPEARRRLDRVVTKADSIRDGSFMAAWRWRADSHGADAALPVVSLRAEPKQGKHLWWGRDLGSSSRRPRCRRAPSGRTHSAQHRGVFRGFGSGGEVAGPEHELMQTCGGVCQSDRTEREASGAR